MQEENILAKDIRVPEWWKDKDSKTMLDKKRRSVNLPDPSYDLDGDNVVSFQDYFLAKQFDLDKDGKLNETERRNALEALKNGYENNFKWNLERSGHMRGGRIIQVRGKFIDSEDFNEVTESYPEHPLSKIKPNVKSFGELQTLRKAENM